MTWVENTSTSVSVKDLQLIKITFSLVPFAWVFQMFFQVNFASTLTGTKFTMKYSIKRIIIVFFYLMINSANFLAKPLPAIAARRLRQRIHTCLQLLKCKHTNIYPAFMNAHNLSGSLTRGNPLLRHPHTPNITHLIFRHPFKTSWLENALAITMESNNCAKVLNT